MKFLADENFNGDIVRGLILRDPELDIVRVQDVALGGEEDPEVLSWAAAQNRIVLTHDRATMVDFAYERVADGADMPGIFIFDHRFPTGKAIEEILLIVACTGQAEWNGRVVFLPLKVG